MNNDFNLLDEPWLAVRLRDGQVVELGLLEVFRRSAEIVALAETTPPSLVAQYRLLLAITHRALSRALGRWEARDRANWYQNGLPLAVIEDYLEHWRERFWLFHDERPFMQVAVLAHAEETRDKRKPWTQISLASASGNTPMVFDHARDDEPVPIRPADAIGTLLGFLQFTPGGLVKTLRDADKAGPLVNTAAVIPVGASLAQTLSLCLHPAPTGHAGDDLPAWEREPLSLAQLRGDPVLASGANDRYTRQSRAVLLLREDDGNVRWLRFAAGFALGEDINAPDPMASFRAGSNGPVRLTFTEGRALWRDLPALVPSSSGAHSRPAKVIEHAMVLHGQLNTFSPVYQPLLIAGLASDQAKLLRWRAEQIALPVSVLEDVENAQQLRELVEKADGLFRSMNTLATSMLSETLPDPTSKDTRSRARSLLDGGPFATCYFATAERALGTLLQLLGQGEFEQAYEVWFDTLRQAAQSAWRSVLVGQGASVRVVRAEAKYFPRFHGLLNQHLPKTESSLPAKEARHE